LGFDDFFANLKFRVLDGSGKVVKQRGGSPFVAGWH